MRMRSHWRYACLLLLLAAYLYGSSLFLTKYPYVHSDEAWLSGLTRQIVETGDFGATEAFFDLKERNPHALKILFHALQALAMRLGGYQIATFRLLSLLAAAPVLIVFYAAARRLFAGYSLPLLAAALLALDIQFIYASHMARQEIFILFAVALNFFLLLRPGALRDRDIAALAAAAGFSAGFHPNAFLVACLGGAALLARRICGSVRGRQIALYIGLTAACAGVFVGISLLLDADFIQHYLAYGQSEFGLNLSLADRAAEWTSFGSKLFDRVSGTYYLPDLRLQLILFPLLGLLLLCYALAMRREQPAQTERALVLIAAELGICAGILLIGRYNQLSIVFLMPAGWLIVLDCLLLFGQRICYALTALLLALLLWVGVTEIRPWLAADYDAYLARLETYLPADARTLGNLNSEYYFENGCLLDYRNLAFLEENGLTLAEYVESRGIEYIVYMDELGYIDANRPYWNIIYGNLDIAGLRTYLAEACEPVGTFFDPVYGTRISQLVAGGEYGHVTVYRVR